MDIKKYPTTNASEDLERGMFYIKQKGILGLKSHDILEVSTALSDIVIQSKVYDTHNPKKGPLVDLVQNY